MEPFSGDLIFRAEAFAVVKENWAATIIENKLVKAEQTLAERLNDAVLNGKKLVDVSANLTTSRLIALGYLQQAQDRQITSYQVNEVLDSRTCEVCL